MADLDLPIEKPYKLRMRHSALRPATKALYDSTGNTRDLYLLAKLSHFDALFSHHLTETLYDKAVLTRLIKGHYLGLIRGDNEISQAAFDYARLKNVFLPLAIWPRGEALLARSGLWKKRRRQSDPFDHKMYRCTTEYSFAYGAQNHGLSLKWLDDLEFDDPNPHHIPVGSDIIVPDTPLVKLKGTKTFCAHVEYDMGTERLFSSDKDSIESKVRRYAQYIENGGFKTQYDLPNITVLFFFTEKSRHEAFPKIVEKVTDDPDIQNRFASQYRPHFRESNPSATDYALGTYQRVAEPLNILEVIHGREKAGGSVQTHPREKGDRPEARADIR